MSGFCRWQYTFLAIFKEDRLRVQFTLISLWTNCELNLWMWLCISFTVKGLREKTSVDTNHFLAVQVILCCFLLDPQVICVQIPQFSQPSSGHRGESCARISQYQSFHVCAEVFVCRYESHPLLLALPCDVSTLLHNTRCLLCQWQENWQLLPMLYTEWFRQGSKSVRSVVAPPRPTFPTFLSIMSSVLSRTSSLFSLDMGNFKDVRLDAPVSRMIAFACFWSASQDIPTPSCQQNFLFNILTSFDIPGFVTKYCNVDLQLRVQLVSHPNKIHRFS